MSDLSRRVAAARRRRDKADVDLRAAIVAARDGGETLQAIADAAKVSRQRIHAMLKGG